MKKAYGILLLFLCCICGAFSVGCGKKEEGIQQGGVVEYRNIQAESNKIFNREGSYGRSLGLQFYEGEPVQIWAVPNDGTADIYLYREDGSGELLLEGMPDNYYYMNWLMDADGGFYCWSVVEGLLKMDQSGKVLYSIPLGDVGADWVEDLCQLADGRVLFIYSSGSGITSYSLAEVAPGTGKASGAKTVKLDGFGCIAAGESGLLYMDGRGVYEIDMDNGSRTSILPFTGTSYQLQRQDMDDIEDFRVLEDGGVEILWSRYSRDTGTTYTSQVLRAGTEATEKAVLSIRCYGFTKKAAWGTTTQGVWIPTQAWLKGQIARFNSQSSSYVVVLDECPDGVEREDFARQTSIEIAAGKGPDLIFGDVLGDYTWGAIKNGALMDLAPYMEASGIREEDYFPMAFSCWKEGGGIYGVCLGIEVESHRISQEVLGGTSEPDVDVEALVEGLLAWEGDEILYFNGDSRWVLQYLLWCSEDFWGMVDWEDGTCDFSGELFAKILEAAKRYGMDERKYPPSLLEYRTMDVVGFDTAADREAEGMAVAGELFDDGCHALVSGSRPGGWNEILAVNTNSAHAEGAWEFISFLLSEEAQLALYEPVNRAAFEVCIKRNIAKAVEQKRSTCGYTAIGDNGEYINMYERSYLSITEEKIAEYVECLENARPLPIRTMPLLDIIYEEAEYYFNGSKSIEEVSAIIQNRVQLYLDENM